MNKNNNFGHYLKLFTKLHGILETKTNDIDDKIIIFFLFNLKTGET